MSPPDDAGSKLSPATVVVAGVGGAGVNAVMRLLDVGLEGVRFVAIDTSDQTLERAGRATRVPLGGVTKGLGTGSRPDIGRTAAEAAAVEIAAALKGAHLAFVAVGLAGGTGGGAGPVVARIAREQEAVTVGFGITPFAFEAPRRAATAESARLELAAASDATVILENERALEVAGRKVALDVALRVADDVLRQAVQGLSELVRECGPINVDLSVVKAMLAGGGECCLALGVGRGESPALTAMRSALESPLSDMRALGQARGVLVQVTGGSDLSVHDTSDAVALLKSQLREDIELVVGTGLDLTLTGACQVTVLGTGLLRAPRHLVEWSAARHDWLRQARGGPTPEPAHRFNVTGQVMGAALGADKPILPPFLAGRPAADGAAPADVARPPQLPKIPDLPIRQGRT